MSSTPHNPHFDESNCTASDDPAIDRIQTQPFGYACVDGRPLIRPEQSETVADLIRRYAAGEATE
ncbi:MAG: hypothetical protein EA396_00295 [Anaerolineaceae bacterium]|nr:MAG: hypothetical protein EA396_00295 [Anaerolineaceae bacterium]